MRCIIRRGRDSNSRSPDGEPLIKLGLGFLYPVSITEYYKSTGTDPDNDEIYMTWSYPGSITYFYRPEESGYEWEKGIYFTQENIGNPFQIKTRIKDEPKYDPPWQISKTSEWSNKKNVTVKWGILHDYSACSKCTYINISSTTYNTTILPVIIGGLTYLDPQNIICQGNFVINDNDTIYDQILITFLTDGNNTIELSEIFQVFYDRETGCYTIDFNSNGQSDPDEVLSSVTSASIPLCEDGNPYD